MGDERGPALASNAPEFPIGKALNGLCEAFEAAQPPLLANGLSPQRIGPFRIPRGYMNAVRHIADRHLLFGPTWEQRLKQAPTHDPMQKTDPIDEMTGTHGERRHGKRGIRMAWIGLAECDEFFHREVKLLHILPHEAADDLRREGVKPGCHRGVGREDIAGPCGPWRLSK